MTKKEDLAMNLIPMVEASKRRAFLELLRKEVSNFFLLSRPSPMAIFSSVKYTRWVDANRVVLLAVI